MSANSILIFDVETTGMDKKRDQVIELCAQSGLEDSSPSKSWRIRPSVEISPGAMAVHGISMADLEGAPCFSEVADEVRSLFVGAKMLVGYNLRFDIDMLQAEFRRLGQASLDLSETYVVDPFRLWQRCEPRSLMDAHKRFVGGKFEDAHSASADVAATGRVLLGMVESFGLGRNWEEVADICEPERVSWVGGTSHLQWNDDNQVIMGFGKHSGVSLSAMAAGSEASYLRWLIGSDFPMHVREVCGKALELEAEALGAWLLEHYARRSRSDASANSANSAKLCPEPERDSSPRSERSEPLVGQQDLFSK